MKFRKKPVVIEALQFDGTHEMARRISIWSQGITSCNQTGELYIGTLEGIMKASKDDWIIRGVKGEFYPCKPDVFEATYEPVHD